MLKIGRIVPFTKEQHSKAIKQGHERKADLVKNILTSQNLYTKEEVFALLNSQYCYKNYFGKAKNRTMQSENLKLYASLIHHTEFLQEYNRYKKLSFSFRLLIAGEYKFEIPEDSFCRCKKHILFDPTTRELKFKCYCKHPGCMLGSSSAETFKYKFGSKWKKHFTNHIKSNAGNRFHGLGKNETDLLNKQEITDNCKIDRHFTVMGYFPDGYCHETNTIYEVYEPHHKYKANAIYDQQRQEKIQEHLKCNFVIIEDYNCRKSQNSELICSKS